MTPKQIGFGFIAFYFLLNIFQATFTQLTSDEGYYWYLSTHLDWGYYDHPPMLGVLIYIGRHLFSGELGVRFVNVALMSVALVFLFRLLEKSGKLQSHLYLIILSLPLFNYISIVVFPDTPLVAFSMIYLYFYKKFIEKKDFVSALIMGIALSAMLYSKYHAVLMVFFVVLSNPALLRNKKFLVSLFITALLFLPHLYWQYAHDFVTVRYQLFGRSNAFDINFVTEYPSVQFLVLAPALVFVPFVYKTKDLFERALKFIVIGTIVFFGAATLKGYVQFHWTSIVLFPIIILGYTYFTTKKKKLFVWLSIPLLLFVFFLRAYLALKILPVNTFNHVDYFHGRDVWAHDIKTIAGDNPVVFEHQLREAPLYGFYAEEPSIAIYGNDDKKTQYQIWNVEDQFQGKDVVIIKDGGNKKCIKLATGMGKDVYYISCPHFSSYQNIRVNLKSAPMPIDSGYRVTVEIVNHRNKALLFEKNKFGDGPALVCNCSSVALKKDTTFAIRLMTPQDSVAPFSSRTIEAIIPFKGWVGNKSIAFGFDDFILQSSINSKKYSF